MQNCKIENGVFYTSQNPFDNVAFKKWWIENDLKNKIITEPFAGNCDLIEHLKKINIHNKNLLFDIHPTKNNIQKNDSFKNFPSNNELVITNPPWLYKSCAKRKNVNFQNNKYDNLYKYALELCLKNSDHVAILLPATYLQSQLFFEYLQYYIIITKKIFNETEQPTCLCLFSNQKTENFFIYENNKYLESYNNLKKNIPTNKIFNKSKIKFNDPNGNIAFISFDDTRQNTIRFAQPYQIDRQVKNTDRMITKIKIDAEIKDMNAFIINLNDDIETFREKTHDIFLTAFKGLRKDGKYRRRMNYNIARLFLQKYTWGTSKNSIDEK